MKIYAVSKAIVPLAWRKAAETDQLEVTMVILAYSKQDVSPLLTDRGMRQTGADEIASRARIQAMPPALVLLLDAEIASLNTVDVLFWASTADGAPIVRVHAAGLATAVLTVVGRFRREGGHVYAEKTTDAKEA